VNAYGIIGGFQGFLAQFYPLVFIRRRRGGAKMPHDVAEPSYHALGLNIFL
jgi:hypothetical protein